VTSQTVPNVHFAKTKFLFHTSLALGAIHRYIYKPLRAGALKKGAPGRVKVLLKGAVAAVFAVHELRLAHDDALSSDLLRPLANKLDGLGHKLSGLVSGLKSDQSTRPTSSAHPVPRTPSPRPAAASASASRTSQATSPANTAPEAVRSDRGAASSTGAAPLRTDLTVGQAT